MRKYRLTDEEIIVGDRKLYRIQALKSFGNVKKGQLGGYIESEKNLSHIGNSWVADRALVFENAEIKNNAIIAGDALVYGSAKVYGDAKVCDSSVVCDNAVIYNHARVYSHTRICDNARVYGNAWVAGLVQICGNAEIFGDSFIYGDANIKNKSDICTMSGFGSKLRTTTAFKAKNGEIHVVCGCFYGNLDDFYKKVEERHGDTLYGREYKKMIELIKIHFGIE